MMIKLFRNIRQKLIEQSKVRNYFFYAIGEIILVVIGILIALQVNNWNNTRAESRTSQNLMSRLLIECEKNQKAFTEGTNRINNLMNKSEQFLQLFGSNYMDKDRRTVDSLIYDLLITPRVEYKSSTINEALNSGTVSLINSDNLRDYLYQIPNIFIEIKRQEDNIDTDSADNFMPYIYEHISLRQIDANFAPIKNRIGSSKLNAIDNRIVLSDRMLESMMDNKFFLLNDLLKKYHEFSSLNTNVINLLKGEIQK